MKILAIPQESDKKYSFELFELLRNYQNEIVGFSGGNKVPDIRFFSLISKLRDSFMSENEAINKKLDMIIDNSDFNFLWNLGLNKEFLPYITRKIKQKGIYFVQTVSVDSVLYEQRNIISQLLFPEICSLSINKLINFYSSDVDLFITHSQYIKDLLAKSGIKESKIINIPMFVDVQKYTPYYKSEDYFVYNYSPKDEPVLKTFLKRMGDLPEYRMIIISENNLSKEIKSYSEKYCPNNVLLLENLNTSQKYNIQKLSRFSVILSGINYSSILESYAQGKPVLALDEGANKEYVVDTYSGLLFKNNKDDIVDKIDFLMNKKSFCEDSGTFARNLAENCFNKKNHYRQIFKAFNSLEQKTLPCLNKVQLLNIS